ncbi:class I adenylate-forming enzyme family protein [Mycolicibacterium sp. XJ1819]
MTDLAEEFASLSSADDDAPMVQYKGRWYSWGEIRALADKIDDELRAAGCGAGGRVAVVLGNWPQSVAALIAILRGDRTLVTLSPLQPPPRLSADLAATEASYVLAPPALWAEQVFTDTVGELDASGWALDESGMGKKAVGAPVAGGDSSVAIEMLTSGTTGPPKRVPLSRRQIGAALSAVRSYAGKPLSARAPLSGPVTLVPFPIVHIGGMWAVISSLTGARPIAMLERFTVEAWHAAVTEHRPRLVGLPPPAVRAVLDADLPREDLSSIRGVNSGTAPVDPALVDEFLAKYGIPILIMYGATEFSGAIAGWSVKDFRSTWGSKHGSVGRAFPGVRLRIISEDGTELPTGETGRLQVSAAQTSPAGDGREWVTTSDLAHLDADGFLYIDGRADDVIVRGGFKVAPDTVAQALRSHPGVHDAAVTGRPDPRLGQVPVAAVELRSGASVTGEELRTHCRSTLTPYEVPTEVYIVDELPRGAALKVDRQQLNAMLDDIEARRPRSTTAK